MSWRQDVDSYRVAGLVHRLVCAHKKCVGLAVNAQGGNAFGLDAPRILSAYPQTNLSIDGRELDLGNTRGGGLNLFTCAADGELGLGGSSVGIGSQNIDRVFHAAHQRAALGKHLNADGLFGHDHLARLLQLMVGRVHHFRFH